MSSEDRNSQIHAQVDSLSRQHPEWAIPSEFEALAWAGRNGDEGAGRIADEIARRAEWEAS